MSSNAFSKSELVNYEFEILVKDLLPIVFEICASVKCKDMISIHFIEQLSTSN